MNCVTAFTFSLISSFFFGLLYSINKLTLSGCFFCSQPVSRQKPIWFFQFWFFSFLFSVFSSFYGSFVTFLVVQATLSYMPRSYPPFSLFRHKLGVPISLQWFICKLSATRIWGFQRRNSISPFWGCPTLNSYNFPHNSYIWELSISLVYLY